LATAFIELVLSQEGQEALASFSFIPVTKPTSGN
jgi:ABC-type Fe3+ transport system substrate-binding protein